MVAFDANWAQAALRRVHRRALKGREIVPPTLMDFQILSLIGPRTNDTTILVNLCYPTIITITTTLAHSTARTAWEALGSQSISFPVMAPALAGPWSIVVVLAGLEIPCAFYW